MFPTKGFNGYKQHWEDQAGFMDKPQWKSDKILKLTISSDFDDNLKEPQFLNHLLKNENGKHTLRLKNSQNSCDLDDFQSKSLGLLGILENWLTDIPLDKSYRSHS